MALKARGSLIYGTSCIVKYEMLGQAAKYGLSDVRDGLSTIRDIAWSCFAQSSVVGLVFFIMS